MNNNFQWNEEKNRLLKEERGVSFEEIVTHILQGDLLSIKEHPNQERYPGQQMFIVRMGDYIYLVHFVQENLVVVLGVCNQNLKYDEKQARKISVQIFVTE